MAVQSKNNLLYNIALTLSNILFPIISFPYVSRVLGPEGIGKIQFVTSFAQYFALIAALGIPIYGIREVAKVKHNKLALSKLVIEMLTIHFATTLVISIVYLLVIQSFSKFSIDFVLFSLAINIPLLGFTSLDWFYIGTEKFKLIAIRSVIIKIISLILLIMLVKTAEDTAYFLVITLFSMLANNVWNALALTKQIDFKWQKPHLKKHLKPLFTIFSTSLSISIYTMLDTILLGFLSTNVATGLYTAAVKLNRVVLPLIVAYGTVLTPQIVKSFQLNNNIDTNKIINKSYAFVCFVGVPTSVALYLFAHQFVELFSGDTFLKATTTMQIMSPIPLLIGLSNIFGMQILNSSGHDKNLFVSVTIGMLASFVLNIIFIPILQENGAALATLIAEVIVTALTYYFVKKQQQITFQSRLFWQALLSSISFVLVYFILKTYDTNSLLLLIIAIPVCSLLYLVLQTFIFKNFLIKTVLSDILKK